MDNVNTNWFWWFTVVWVWCNIRDGGSCSCNVEAGWFTVTVGESDSSVLRWLKQGCLRWFLVMFHGGWLATGYAATVDGATVWCRGTWLSGLHVR